ncbi:RNase P subunit p30 family protein [Caldisphaera sp.]|uniref:RNase P subunit p30 family protein n=1 Tax=Caldisphaera sp. TaxID=2060322 RepID=UPI0025C59C79|nr:RNase P subunit p30 family protein [Caldisphaera sp.]
MNYLDLSVNPKSYDEWVKMAEKLNRMGFNYVGLESKFIDEKIIKIAEKYSINIIKRNTFKINNKEELNEILKHTKKDAILVAEPKNNHILNSLNLIQEVNSIRISVENNIRINKSLKNLFNIAKKGTIEISMRPLLYNNNLFYLREFINLIRNSVKLKIKFYVVSDAACEYELWHPAYIKSLFAVLGIEKSYSIMALTTYPYNVFIQSKYH